MGWRRSTRPPDRPRSARRAQGALGAAAPPAATTRRFVRESRLAGSLNHPNIVTVHDFFEDRGTPYIAMEFLERGSLRPLMSGLTLAQVAGVLDGAAGRARARARARHRAPRPQAREPDGQRPRAREDRRLRDRQGDGEARRDAADRQGTTIGTPTYMAPEQAMGGEIGPRTDLYAVGMIAFELLAGRPPFDTPGADGDAPAARQRGAAIAARRPPVGRTRGCPTGSRAARHGARAPRRRPPRGLARVRGDRARGSARAGGGRPRWPGPVTAPTPATLPRRRATRRSNGGPDGDAAAFAAAARRCGCRRASRAADPRAAGLARRCS